jgi:hypothetical protein
VSDLADIEEALALFTEGIAGQYLHIKASAEFASHHDLRLADDGTGQTHDTVFLPDSLDGPGSASYRVLVMEQIGLRECGTHSFRFAEALEQVSGLAERYVQPRDLTPRSGDYHLLFGCFRHSGLAAELFNVLEQARVHGHLQRSYPGLNKHTSALHNHYKTTHGLTGDPLDLARRHLWGDEGLPQEWSDIYARIDALSQPGTTVYDSVQGLCDLYDEIAALFVTGEEVPYAPQDESLTDWVNREQRIAEWDKDLEQMDSAMIAVDMFEGDEVEAELADAADGSVREADVDIKSLKDERDTLQRRIEMERSSVQHALGADRSIARSFRYDEWDYLNHTYLRHWCRVFEEPLVGSEDDDIAPLNEAIRRYQPLVQQRLEQIRPTGLQRIKRVQDGDELDIEAIIEARQDIRAGQSPDERVYSRKERMHRDVCALFLVDLSASTDDPVEKPEPIDWSDIDPDETPNLRDPWYAELDEEPPEEPGRKIIDVQRDAMVVMASALDALGDAYGIYGFSGYGKDCVEIFIAKEPDHSFSQATLKSIAAMKPKRSTRMGPAIRHGVHKLTQSGHAMKVLIVISDGFPQDSDYGPERGEHDYGVEDTAMALAEAHQKGVETFCITVDLSGHDYLKRMCPDARYMVIEEMEDLPDQLTKVYTTLTGR